MLLATQNKALVNVPSGLGRFQRPTMLALAIKSSKEKLVKKVILSALCCMAISANAENVVVSQAKKAGVKHCLPAIEKISDFLIEEGNAGVHSIWSSDSPDKQAFTAVIERNYSDGTIVTNLNVTHAKSGQCFVEYEKIVHFNKSCLAAAQSFKGAEYKGEVNKEVGALNHNGVNVYLIPAGTNCIALRKETIMDGLTL